MRKHTTRQSKNPGNKCLISTDKGRFYLHLPFSIGRSFSIGNVTFTNNGTYYSADRSIPDSWIVDISH